MVVACLGGGGVYRLTAEHSRDFFGGVRIWNIQSAVFVPTVGQPWSPSPLVDGRGRRLGLRQEVSQLAAGHNQRLDLLLEFLDAVWKVCRNLCYITAERERSDVGSRINRPYPRAVAHTAREAQPNMPRVLGLTGSCSSGS